MRIFTVCVLIFFAMIFSSGIVFADSCPYCGESYGDPWPGDEARVYALRAEHEANCPDRPQAGGGGGGGGGYNRFQAARQAREEEAWLLAQQQWEEEMRRRQEEEKKRKERQARDQAAAQARRQEFEQAKSRMFSMMKGATGGLGFKSSTGGEAIELKPKGTDFFGIFKKQGETGPPVQTKTLGPVRTPPSASEAENLRRALWLYQKAAQAGNAEEARFLSEQADAALQGKPLRVEVPPPQVTQELDQKKLIQFRDLAQDVQEERIRYEDVSRNLHLAEDKKNQFEGRKSSVEEEIKAIDQELAKPKPEVESGPRPAPLPTPDPALEEKKKKKDDLTKELEELKRLMAENEKSLNELKQGQKDAESDLAKGEKKLEDFKKK